MIRKVFGGLLMLSVISLPAAQADTLMVVKEGTQYAEDTGESARNSETVATYWSRADRMTRTDGTGSRMTARLDLGVSWLIDDHKQTCSALDFGDVEPASSATAREPAQFRSTGETRTVGSWQARGFVLDIAEPADDSQRVTLWVSSDLSPSADGYRAYADRTVRDTDMFWMADMFDLGGFPVRYELGFAHDLTVSWELVSIEEKAAPPGTYEVPSGYSGCER